MNLQPPTWIDLFARLDAANNKDQIIRMLDEIAAKLGFRYWAYGVKTRNLPGSRSIEVLDSYPSGWMSHYLAEEYIEIDSSVALAMKRSTTISWVEARPAGGDRLWNDAADFGLKHGLAHPSWDRLAMFGLLTVARESDPVSAAEFASISPYLAWVSSLIRARLNRPGRWHPPSDTRLSSRELEVLKWTALGKTAAEVALIIGVGTRTVNFHIGNILAKLDVTNKVQAVIRATVLGIL
ncbi:hypothetical protein BWP39_03060 [Paraburkholderia acidicola]|uniref:HTH luxR-type domain-containing protein n=1 Tax=Paraburkholderia acidicola TaxID=1912599 RepID=A0A2A4F521_9BURK|nr:autoinducer binding domain-containing protein [Paraburkholderia acidicola]PCE27496.1 hypothetical protein BWP39_03060 [Paraburkholderia acidicola]